MTNRRSSVRDLHGRASARYHVLVRDLVFVALVIAFFALATVFVAGCERIIGRSEDEERVR